MFWAKAPAAATVATTITAKSRFVFPILFSLFSFIVLSLDSGVISFCFLAWSASCLLLLCQEGKLLFGIFLVELQETRLVVVLLSVGDNP